MTQRVSSDGFGLTTLTALVMTGMIGSGVFVTTGFAVDSLGSRTLVMAAWLVGGLVALCGAVAYGGLARRLQSLVENIFTFHVRSIHFVDFLLGLFRSQQDLVEA